MQLTVALLFVGVLALIGVVDAIAVSTQQATVSQLVRGWCRDWPLLAVLIGLVLGHLFWCRG